MRNSATPANTTVFTLFGDHDRIIPFTVNLLGAIPDRSDHTPVPILRRILQHRRMTLLALVSVTREYFFPATAEHQTDTCDHSRQFHRFHFSPFFIRHHYQYFHIFPMFNRIQLDAMTQVCQRQTRARRPVQTPSNHRRGDCAQLYSNR